MPRRYNNPIEGVLEHGGITYKSPETDEQWLMTLLLGELLFCDEIVEIWILDEFAIITVNELKEIFS